MTNADGVVRAGKQGEWLRRISSCWVNDPWCAMLASTMIQRFGV